MYPIPHMGTRPNQRSGGNPDAAADRRHGTREQEMDTIASVKRWDLHKVPVEAHQPEVLHSEGEGRTILIRLPAGGALQEHQVHERAWLVVVDGEIEVDGGQETVAGGPGFLAVFDPKERHEVRARSESRLLLLLAPWPGEGHPSLREA
jgi:quercetin dioxygenase-like cupin family protein